MKTYYNTNAILERFNLPDDIQYTIYRKMFDNVLKDIACPECAICEERYNISKNKAEADCAGFGYGDYYDFANGDANPDADPDSCFSCFCSQNCLCSCEKCEVMFDLNDEMTKALRIDISDEYYEYYGSENDEGDMCFQCFLKEFPHLKSKLFYLDADSLYPWYELLR